MTQAMGESASARQKMDRPACQQSSGQARQEPAGEQFRPVLAAVRLSARAVRPGDWVSAAYIWQNGGGPSHVPLWVFVHFEHSARGCQYIRFQQDHEPSVPTRAWQSGERVVDGPYLVRIPADAQEGLYFLHVGLFDPEDGKRLYEGYAGSLMVSSRAPSPRASRPRLGATELRRRRNALEARLKDCATLSSSDLKLMVSRRTGWFALVDKKTKQVWHASPFMDGLCRVELSLPEGSKIVAVDRLKNVEVRGKTRIRLIPRAPELEGLILEMQLQRDGRSVEITCELDAHMAMRVESVRLLDEAVWTSDVEGGYVVVPSRLGLLLPADSGLAFVERFPTFHWGGCQMQMLGLVKNGSALLVTWEEPSVEVEVRSVLSGLGDQQAPGGQVLACSLIMRKNARTVRLSVLGKGDYVSIARAYRQAVRKRGLLMTLTQKSKATPHLDLLMGAPEFKPFTLSRVVESSRLYSGPEGGAEQVFVGYTFDEVAKMAEHLKKDLKLDRALFVLAGWVRRGYDNQHPDILPSAAECGGDGALADCSRRIRELGYLFGLHDNYQDIYRDAPSWNEGVVMKDSKGRPMRGGNWAGGQAWLVCSQEGLRLAQRPDTNLPKVKELFSPTAYFTDTTFAAPPYECHDPQHPLTVRDDIEWKTKLCDFSQSLFGIVGSEEGMEWAVPHAHYFEGILSCWTQAISGLPHARLIPLFELAYRDCVALYTHQGDRAGPASAAYIAYHVLLGRMPLYSFGPHSYWESEMELPLRPRVAEVKRAGLKAFTITYEWKVEGEMEAEKVKGLHIFVHFVDSAGKAALQDDHEPQPPLESWQAGSSIVIGPRKVEIPAGTVGKFEVRIGLYREGMRAGLLGRSDGEGRIIAGVLTVRPGIVQVSEPAAPSMADPTCFARADNGWAERLGRTDRFIKNTFEILSPLNRFTGGQEIAAHEFLDAQGLVQRTTFSGGTQVLVNLGQEVYEYSVKGDRAIRLPPYGFVINSPGFVAFHALDWGGLSYSRPVLFTVRSLDGKPLSSSRRARVYHGFGDERIELWRKVRSVRDEAVVTRS